MNAARRPVAVELTEKDSKSRKLLSRAGVGRHVPVVPLHFGTALAIYIPFCVVVAILVTMRSDG